MEYINLTGLVCQKSALQMNKYNIDFPKEVIEHNIRRLTNQIWKLIPMFEHEEDWNKQLETVIIEIAGLNEIFIMEPQFLQALVKLEGLKIKAQDIKFSLYRKTVFEIIGLIQDLKYET